MAEYDELRIRIWKVGSDKYFVLANGLASAGAVIELNNPGRYARELNALLDKDFGRTQAPAVDPTASLERLGRELYRELFPEPIHNAFEKSNRIADGLSRRLRVRFYLPPELEAAGLPLEILDSPNFNGPLVLFHRFSVVRSPKDPPAQPPRLPPAGEANSQLTIVVVTASPDGRDDLAVEREVALLNVAANCTIVRIEHATRQKLRHELPRVGENRCAILVICHGEHDGDKGYVILERADRAPDNVDEIAFANLISQAQGARFVALNICKGAVGNPHNPLSGIGKGLIASGIPVVSAFRFEVADSAAAKFSPTLFREIALQHSVDHADNSARNQIRRTEETNIEWCTPALFLHDGCSSGIVFGAGAPLKAPHEGIERAIYLSCDARAKRKWRGARELAQAGREQFGDEEVLSAIVIESSIELALNDADFIYRLLAQNAGAPAVDAKIRQLRASHSGVMDYVIAPLNVLVGELREAHKLDRDASQCAEQEEWDRAFSLYTDVAKLRPDYPDIKTKIANARKESETLAKYNQATRNFREKNWGQAIGILDAIVQTRGEYKDVRSLLQEARLELDLHTHYSEAQQKESSREFESAASGYEYVSSRRPDYDHTTQRLAYCQAMINEQTGAWTEATARYRGVGTDIYPDAPHRLQYAEGRSAELQEDWPQAEAKFGPLPDDYRDAAARARYARARKAESAEDWQVVLQELNGLPGEILDGAVGRQVARAFQSIHQLGAESERRQDWERASHWFGILPYEYRDAGSRGVYATGRFAEQREDWAAAEAAYGGTGWEDSRQRLIYAHGRFAEGDQRWEQAAAQYTELDIDYRDLKHRVPYCIGRKADQNGDWQGVVDGFGVLMDPEFGGDVGHFRSYARARVAEANGNWSEVVEALRPLDDSYRDGDAGHRRAYAKGRKAIQAETWQGAREEFGQLPPGYQDAAHWREYASGRAAEDNDWDEAARCFELLPAGFADRDERCPYAKARAAEARGQWSDAGTEITKSRDRYRDTAQRRIYYDGRKAAQTHAWTEAHQVFEKLGGFLDSRNFCMYAQAMVKREEHDWSGALAIFSALPVDWLDTYRWKAYAEGRTREQSGRLAAAVETYKAVPESFQDVADRVARLKALLEAAPWLDVIAAAELIADSANVGSGPLPYDILRPADITPDSPQKVVMDASFVLMERGMMTPEIRLAWDQLRRISDRLLVDAWMYPVRKLDSIRQIQQQLLPAPEKELLQEFCRAVPENAALILLVAGRPETAIARWEESQRKQPSDSFVAHCLAIAYSSRAWRLEGGGAFEQAELAWERAIANWTMVLTDDKYWLPWRQRRAAVYQERVSEGDVAGLRSGLSEQVARAYGAYSERCLQEGKKERAARYRKLGLAFEIELEGARTLKEAGGLTLSNGQSDNLCCGILALRILDLTAAFGAFVVVLERRIEESSVEETGAEADELPAVLGKGDPDLILRLRAVFSELGAASVLMDHQNFEGALESMPESVSETGLAAPSADCDALERERPEHMGSCQACGSFAELNPAYLYLAHRSLRLSRDAAELTVRIHLAFAESALTSGADSVQTVLDQWRQSIQMSRRAGSQVRTKRLIARAALGRATALERERGQQRGQRLSEAIDLLEAVRGLVGGTASGPLEAKESELLIRRGVWFGYGCHEWEDRNFDKAESDLRRAVQLNPLSVQAHDNLTRALVFHAISLHHEGERSRPLVMLTEALGILDGGLRRFANHSQLQRGLRNALDEIEELLLSRQSQEDLLGRLDKVLSEPSGTAGEAPQVDTLLQRARQKLSNGDFTGAALELIEAARLNPSHQTIRTELIAAMRERAGG